MRPDTETMKKRPILAQEPPPHLAPLMPRENISNTSGQMNRGSGRDNGSRKVQTVGCRSNRSAIDTLMMTLTTAQEQLRHNSTYMRKVNRPSIMINGVGWALNCVQHPTLINILTHYGFPTALVNTITKFHTNRSIYMDIDGERESLVHFNSGLPQGSLLSPILFIIYGAAIEKYHAMPTEQTTTYDDNEVMIQEAERQHFATQCLQERLDVHINTGLTLNIQYSPAKTELLHFAAGTKKAARDDTCIRLYGENLPPTNYFKSLRVWIDHRLSFKRHTTFASSRASGSTGAPWKLTKRKSISPGTLHHLLTSAAIPGFTW